LAFLPVFFELLIGAVVDDHELVGRHKGPKPMLAVKVALPIDAPVSEACLVDVHSHPDDSTRISASIPDVAHSSHAMPVHCAPRPNYDCVLCGKGDCTDDSNVPVRTKTRRRDRSWVDIQVFVVAFIEWLRDERRS
jgi:hypothetical protein